MAALAAATVAIRPARVAERRPLPRVCEMSERLEGQSKEDEPFDAMRKKIARRARNQNAPYRCIDAVQAALDGSRTIIFPTRMNLEKRARSKTPEDAIAAAASSEIVPVLPWTERRDDGNYICIPPEAGYDVSEEKMPDRPSG